MNVIVTCPNCQKELETDDDVGRLQCLCGTTLEVPPSGKQDAENNGVETACPNCQVAVPAGGVICTSCGYNMQTGQIMGTSMNADVEESESVLDRSEGGDYEEDEQVDVFNKYKPLFKLGALVVVILIGVGIYMAANAKNFGITSKTPLGTEAEVEAYLQKIGMVARGEKGTDENGNTAFTYWDKELFIQTKKSTDQWVTIHADSSGKVVAILGTYDASDIGAAGGRTCGFLRTLWEDLGGNVKEKSISTDTLHAKWTQGVQTIGVNQLFDETVGATLLGSPYVKAIDSFCTHVDDNGDVIMAP
jgi:hypothetical protein